MSSLCRNVCRIVLKSRFLSAPTSRSGLTTSCVVQGGKWINPITRELNPFSYKTRKAPPKAYPVKKEDNLAKPIQEWWDWDGIGRYKYRSHDYPNNMTLRDVQRRRIFARHAQDRLRLNCIIRNDILPVELRQLADKQKQTELPRPSSIYFINRRCTITGRPRGVFHQFRVSRFIFRQEADYNKVSGCQRAFWIKGVDIDP